MLGFGDTQSLLEGSIHSWFWSFFMRFVDKKKNIECHQDVNSMHLSFLRLYCSL